MGMHERTARKGEVFSALFDEHVSRVRRHVECYLADDDDVQDVVADVFRLGWEKLNPDQPWGLTWLLRSAQNKLRDRERKEGRGARALEALQRDGTHQREEIHPLERVAVLDALSVLTNHERQVVVLTYWDELSAGEVAEVLQLSPGSVWTTLSRARVKLRSKLSNADEGASDGRTRL